MPHEDVSVKAQWLRQTVKDEGCACWITNTVDRAQKLFAAVTEREPELDCLLLHARFPLEERQALEQQVVDKYGPDGQRPLRGVVIGTQVLEQSLDLDFDVMVSDLAPIDLLLQRAGRLHRHQRPRPNAHRTPHFWIHCELAEDGRLEMGKDKFYTEYILRRTWQTLKGREEITLPQAYRPLVEAVYAEEAPPEDSPLAAAWEALQTQQSRARQEAQLRLLPEPEADRPFCAHNRPEFEEDENSTAWMVAQTRLGPETVTVVPLEKEGGWARLVPLGERVELGVQLPRATELRLLRRSLRLSQWTAVQALKEVTDPLFAESSLLKNVVPLWLVENRTTLTAGGRSITLTLDEKLGLLIEVQEPARS